MIIPYKHQLRDVRWNIESKRSYSKKKGTTYHRYCNDVLTFDIEVTSAWLKDDEVIGYHTGESAEYWNNLEPLALCYIWQFSFNDEVYYGRDLKDFKKVLDDIPSDYEVVIWVHNLAYEFHFLSNIIEWSNVFARTPHKPMKAIPKKYPHIEFRCSYNLTRLSLESWGKQLGVHKASGDLDYDIMRTPLTPLTEQELYYCEMDCRVVCEGIRDYLKRYKTIRNIPLTQTGTVRRVVKELLTSDAEYVKHVKKLVPKDAQEYHLLMDIFAGGYTHANRVYAGHVQEGIIEHYDFASSYPTVMVAEKYPDSIWTLEDAEMPSDDMFEDYAYIFELRFTNIECQTCNTYLQAAKSSGSNLRLDNGRVLRADKLDVVCTEQDWLTIRDTYHWDGLEVQHVWVSKKNYLPNKFVDYILDLYKNKTTLKDVEGQEDLYVQSKQYINSMYGMTVTAIVQPNVKYQDGTWVTEPLTAEYVNKKLTSLASSWPSNKKYFLSYSWGCWVTAYARRNLWKCIESVDDKVLYCDTDSIFVLDHQDFGWYNDEITNKLKTACTKMKLDFEKTRPVAPNGKQKPLGIFAAEDECTEFVSLGAKRYVERRLNDRKLHLTVSGINKSAVALLNDDIYNFVDGFEFDKDSPHVKKKISTYLENMPSVTWPDGYVSKCKSGINLRNNGYLLTVTDEYKKLIDYMHLDLDDLEDNVIIRLNSSFIPKGGQNE